MIVSYYLDIIFSNHFRQRDLLSNFGTDDMALMTSIILSEWFPAQPLAVSMLKVRPTWELPLQRSVIKRTHI